MDECKFQAISDKSGDDTDCSNVELGNSNMGMLDFMGGVPESRWMFEHVRGHFCDKIVTSDQGLL